MTRLINGWCTENDEKMVKLLMIMPSLLLQRTSKKGKARENKELLRRRLELWNSGKFDELVNEGKSIQQRLTNTTNKKQNDDDLIKQFRNHMIRGNVNAALRLLDNTNRAGILPINDETMKQLHEKHPEGEPLHEEMLLNGPIRKIHPVIFDEINADLVKKVAIKTKGAAGPSQFDADDWRGVLGSRLFGSSSGDLCTAIANMAKKLCTEELGGDGGLSALMACRLIPLDKDPGLRPIGIGEVLRRIIGKAVVWVLRPELQEDAGDLQMCVGQEGGCEAGIHAMHQIYNEEETHGLIQVDANNAFNTINRNVFMHNIKVICPEIATYVLNCYRKPARLFVVGGIEISSAEGTTQGDPVAMPSYALGIIPLMIAASEPLHEILKARQSAYADDLTGIGTIDELKRWWDLILHLGQFIGYYAKPSKSWLIVKEEYLEYATEIFMGSGLQITTEGKRHLGAVVGSQSFKEEYVSTLVDNWIEEVKVLGKIARVDPHLAYTAYTFGLQHRYTYHMRTIPNIAEQLMRLDDAIDEHLIKHLVNNYNFTQVERRWFSLPPRLGGLGINILAELSDIYYQNSKQVTAVLVERIVNQYNEGSERVENNTKPIKEKMGKEKTKREEEKLNYIRNNLNQQKLRVLEATTEKGASNWLTTLPIQDHGFYLSKQMFWDTVYLRYGIQLPRLPSKCVCGANYNIEHALTCKKGGFINIRHNDVRDFTAEVLSEVCKDVCVEPLLTPLSGETFTYKSANKEENARLDVAARGVWVKGSRAYFDIRVFNPLAQSYHNQNLKAAHKSNENAKKREYGERVQSIEHGSFTPLVFSCFGGMSVECTHFYNRLADMISDKRNINKSQARTWIRTKLSFGLLRTANLCIRGSRTRKQEVETLANTTIEVAMIDTRLDEIQKV